MIGEFYVVVRMGDRLVVHGPRHCEATGPDIDAALDRLFYDVHHWEHGNRIGARKRGLRGWKTLTGAMRSRTWTDRAFEASIGYEVTIGVHRQHTDRGPDDYTDYLETVATVQQAGVSESSQPGEDVGITLGDPEDD